MIKTEFFDDEYNSVNEIDAQLILQSIYDDNGNLIKKIEWSPKFKSYSTSNEDARNRIISKNVQDHYLEIIIGVQRAIDLLWRYHGMSDDITQKQQILNTLFIGYERINFALSNFDYDLRHKKRGFDFEL
jgi:hypothetical protein